MEKNLNESNKKIKDLNDRFKFTSKRKLGESNWMKGSLKQRHRPGHIT